MNGAEILTKFTADTSQVDKATKGLTNSFGKLTGAFTLGNLAAKGISKAISTLTANLDNAIKRTDTINNFPKVMSNLGIGAEDAEQAISILSKKLQGLPTSLDSAASAVQRFTSGNGDIKKSTKYFLAVNNAILAGGAPMEIQKSALEQLSQAYAKGKPDMMEWRTLMSAMPAQLKQVATAMGYVNATQLGTALREGDVSMDKFMATIEKMNTQGVKGFKSFEEQARNSTGGIGTSVTNMKTAITRGIANMLDSTNKSLEPMGGISGVLAKIGKAGEKAFSAIGTAIQKIIPVIINIANWIKEHQTLVMTLTTIIVTFIATFKTIQTIIAIINAVKIAFATLNAVMAANPIGLIIAAIVAVIAAIVLLWKKCDWFRNAVKKVIDVIKNIIMTVATVAKNVIGAIVKGVQTGVQWIKNVIGTVVNFFSGIINAIINFIKPIVEFVKNIFLVWAAIFFSFWEKIINFLVGIGKWIYNNVIAPVVNFVKNAFTLWWETFKKFWTTIFNFLQTVGSWIYNHVIAPVVNFFKTAFTNIWNFIKKVIDKIKSAFFKVRDAVKTAFNAVKKTITTIFDTIGGIIKKPINAIINGINKVIDKINGLKVPDWVPGIGGKSPNFNKIPTLKVGTNYLPEDTLAYLHQGEAVIPKKFNPYANGLNASTLGSMGGNNNIIINITNDMSFDPLGQMVNKVKTYSGGAKNDYNFGMGR